MTTATNNYFDSSDAGVSVTIKYGKGYEDTWANFRGSPAEIRAQLIEFFGMESASVTDLSLSGVVLNATNIAHAKGNIAAGIGATAIGGRRSSDGGADEAQADPWAQAAAAEQKAAADPHAELRAGIDVATTTADLKKFWAQNQAAFAASPELMEAYKAKGKALSAAAKSS